MLMRRKILVYTKLSLKKLDIRMKKEVLVEAGPVLPNSKTKVDFEEALDIAGAGKYQLYHCILMVLVLSSALLEMIATAFVLPAAVCDLNITNTMKGVLTGLPNIGIILSSTLWGWAADTFGRRSTLIISTTSAGILGAASAFMPNLVSFALLKFFASLFLACPSSLPFAYGGELVPRRHRDFAVIILSASLMMMSTLSPVLAWIILPLDINISLGSMNFHAWRVLTVVYILPLLISSLLLIFAKESPKFLVTKGKYDDASTVLKYIYATNSGRPQEEYPASLEHLQATEESFAGATSILDLLRPPHLKWICITGFLMFGIFCILNGLFLFAADTINKEMSGSNEENGTICLVIETLHNETSNGICMDTISTSSLKFMSITTFVYALLVLAASFVPVSKKVLLLLAFAVVAAACLTTVVVHNRIVASVAMSALQLTALGIGPLSAFAVHLFPTALRGSAVGGLMMFGRVGSVVGANVSGIFLQSSCSATFYGFAIFLIVCAVITLSLPSHASHNAESSRTS